MVGRPPRVRLERRRHRRQSQSRCHRTTVSGRTSTSAVRPYRQGLAMRILNTLSTARSRGRLAVRFNALSCGRRAIPAKESVDTR
jgi:hypothetical protein